MGNSMTAFYRLVYFQPNPEDGDRVSVALLLGTDSHVEMLYDPAFPKLKCLAPNIDSKLIQIYLDDLELHLNRNSSEVDFLLRKHAPHFVTSQVRKLAWPLSDTARIQLVQRFLSKEKAQGWAESRRAENDLSEHLQQLVEDLAGGTVGDSKIGAKPEWILGRRIPQIQSVALAVRKRSGILLIDGVNLRESKPKAAIRQAEKVAHTFWQYGRHIEQMEFGRIQGIQRIGVVLNGAENASASYKDAHDYAFHAFEREGDVAVDAGRPDSLRMFKEVIAEA